MYYYKKIVFLLAVSGIIFSAYAMQRPASKRRTVFRLPATLRGKQTRTEQQASELAPIMTAPLLGQSVQYTAHPPTGGTPDSLTEFASHWQDCDCAHPRTDPPPHTFPSPGNLQQPVPPPIPPHRYSLQRRVLQRQARPGERDYQDFQACAERRESTTSHLTLPPGSPPKKVTEVAEAESDYIPVVASHDGELVQGDNPCIVIDSADANTVDEYGRPRLWNAVAYGLQAEVEALLRAGADFRVTREGDSLLHAAARAKACPAAIIPLLLAQQVNPNAHNSSGLAPIHLVARSGDVEKLNALLQQPGAQVDIATREVSQQTKRMMTRTALHMVAACKSERCRQMAEMLFRARANLFAPDERGRTPLEIATDADNAPLVPFLLHHTPIGHQSVQKAYDSCTNPKVNVLFEDRPDVTPHDEEEYGNSSEWGTPDHVLAARNQPQP